MPRNVPVATYRIQLTSAFGFDQSAAIVPYLKQLGISHFYASPFMRARAGSTHGYDIVDHSAFNPEFGGEAAFNRLSQALAEHDIGLILDFVPNHMGVGSNDNRWWLDVLEWGPRSPHAASFDIAWETLPYKREGGVLLPILGRHYGEVLESGELKLAFDATEGTFSVWYFDHRLPIRPNRYDDIIRTAVSAAQASGRDADRLLALAAEYSDPGAPSYSRAPALKSALASIEGAGEIFEQGLIAYRPSAEEPGRAATLHRLLERQHYRLAHWRVAVDEINYRRFFDVNDLAGIRVEDLGTFAATHALVARLVNEGRLHGLRIDHIDGLYDPVQYCRRLRSLVNQMRPPEERRRPFYIVVEKILGEGEPMIALPGVAGTTGYEWMNVISRALVQNEGLEQLDRLLPQFTRDDRSFHDIFYQAKRRVLDSLLSSEFTVLSRLLSRIAAGHWPTRDFTADRLRAALHAYVLHFPVYRTYVSAAGPADADRRTIESTIEKARASWFGPDAQIFDFLKDVLTLDLIGPDRTGYSIPRVRQFAFKVQQFTGPMMAKSLEDTTFYRYFRLVALNEVGNEPELPGLSADEFHARMRDRLSTFPHGLTATATHDTKRGEDARLRILALAEITEHWTSAVSGWRALNERHATQAGSRRAPSLAHEYMLYQSLLGAWPLEGVDDAFVERFEAYLLKAVREGKAESSWTQPDEAYEQGLTTFFRTIVDRARSAEFVTSFNALAQRTALLGALNSLAQVTLKAAMPGVPDFYQGTEMWDLSLVDPDNRRPVDFDRRAAALESLSAAANWEELLSNWPDGRVKFALTQRLLALRGREQGLFMDGAYVPLGVAGSDKDRVIAFARTQDRSAVVVVAMRHLAPFTDGGRTPLALDGLDAELQLSGVRLVTDVLRPDRQLPASARLVDLLQGFPVGVFRAQQSGRRAL